MGWKFRITKSMIKTRPDRNNAFQVFRGFKPTRFWLPNNGIVHFFAVHFLPTKYSVALESKLDICSFHHDAGLPPTFNTIFSGSSGLAVQSFVFGAQLDMATPTRMAANAKTASRCTISLNRNAPHKTPNTGFR